MQHMANKDENRKNNKIISEFMRDTAEIIRGHSMDMTNTTFICDFQVFHMTSTKFCSTPMYD